MKQAFTILAAVAMMVPLHSGAEPVLVPVIQGDWIHVYQPQPDAFPGPDSPRFKTGRTYDDRQVNDHCILKGPDHRWQYIRSLEAMADWVIFTVERSDTLAAGSWTHAGVTEELLSDDGIKQTMKATVAAGAGGQRFLHLRISTP